MIRFTIPIPPVSKKNSQRILTNRATGRPFIMPSQKYKDYEEAAVRYLPKLRQDGPIDGPVNVKCVFYMPTRRKCDLVNMLEAADDVLVKGGLLSDDNYTVIHSHDGSCVMYDKENPRTEIEIEEVSE